MGTKLLRKKKKSDTAPGLSRLAVMITDKYSMY